MITDFIFERVSIVQAKCLKKKLPKNAVFATFSLQVHSNVGLSNVLANMFEHTVFASTFKHT